jgi:hypothetical protein
LKPSPNGKLYDKPGDDAGMKAKRMDRLEGWLSDEPTLSLSIRLIIERLIMRTWIICQYQSLLDGIIFFGR